MQLLISHISQNNFNIICLKICTHFLPMSRFWIFLKLFSTFQDRGMVAQFRQDTNARKVNSVAYTLRTY